MSPTPQAQAQERLEELRARIMALSPADPRTTEEILVARFGGIPNKLTFALERWPLATSRVLDVGCAYGHCLAHFGPGSLGIDNRPEQVAFCRAIGMDVLEFDVDAGTDDIPDAAFDYVWVSDIIEHLDCPRLLLRRLARKLAPDGRLLVYIATRPRGRLAVQASRYLFRFRHQDATPYEAGTHYYQFTRETASYLLERAGYRVEHIAVPMLRGSHPTLNRVLAGSSPTLIIEARRDPAAERATALAEAENKPAIRAGA